MPKQPYVFIGSSSEGLNAAKAIQANLEYACESHIWSQGLFGLSEGTLETLVNKVDAFDFAVLCLTPDDLTISRGEEKKSPRDNVVLELGLFMGKLGRERVYIVIDRDANAKMPSDLAGITPAAYKKPDSGNWQSALGPATTAIENEIKRLGLRKSPYYDLGFQISWFANGSGIGFHLVVTNCDVKPLPPHTLSLHRPSNSFSLFDAARAGEQLSTQVRDHSLLIWEGANADSLTFLVKHLLGIGPHRQPLTDEQVGEFVFEIKLQDSNTVLYQSKELGTLLVKLIRHFANDAKPNGVLMPDELGTQFAKFRKVPC